MTGKNTKEMIKNDLMELSQEINQTIETVDDKDASLNDVALYLDRCRQRLDSAEQRLNDCDEY